MSNIGLTATRFLFGTAGRLAPTFAGRMAFRLFARTPNPDKVSDREKLRLYQAAKAMAAGELHYLPTRQGISVAAREFTPTGIAARERWALVLHGWRSRSEHMLGVVETLRSRGFHVVALDLPGHGQSAGRRLTMADAVAAVSAAAFRFGPFNLIAGHSFGGAVAVNSVVGSIAGIRPVWTRRLVLIAAPSGIGRIFRQFGQFIGLGPKAQAAMEREVLRVAGRPLSQFSGSHLLKHETLPVLVVHAPDDKEVPFSEAEDYAAAGRHVRLLPAPGTGHRRILADSNVLAAIAEFADPQPDFIATVARLPAGKVG
jgi:pimeloyl-ACP methyl ester carboxylesterase